MQWQFNLYPTKHFERSSAGMLQGVQALTLKTIYFFEVAYTPNLTKIHFGYELNLLFPTKIG